MIKQNVYISFIKSEMKELAFDTEIICMRKSINPLNNFITDDLSNLPEPSELLKTNLKECNLFVGIYGDDYGEKKFRIPNSKKLVSKIEFELYYAKKEIKDDNIFCFFQNPANEGDRDVEIENLRSKYNLNIRPFDNHPSYLNKLGIALKDWFEKNEGNSKIDHSRYHSIGVSGPDKAGILSATFGGIKKLRGNIIQSSQTNHDDVAHLQIIADWNTAIRPPSESHTESVLRKELEAIYSSDSMAYVKVDVISTISDSGDIKAKAIYNIEFFDNIGMADRIFRIFSSQGISILESEFKQISSNPPQIGLFKIVTDVSHVNIEVRMNLKDSINQDANVFRVDEYVEHGSWWY